MQMESWRQRGYVPDSDEEDGFDSLEAKKINCNNSPEPGSLEYIDLPSSSLKEGSSSQPKGQRDHRTENGSITLSDTEDAPIRTPNRITLEVQIPSKPRTEQGPAQKRQSFEKTVNGTYIHSTNTQNETTTPEQRRGRRTYGTRSSATKIRNRQSSELPSTNTPAKTTDSIYDIPLSSQEQESPRPKPSSHKSIPKTPMVKLQSESQVIPEPQTPLIGTQGEGSNTRNSSPDELMLIPERTRQKSHVVKYVQPVDEPPLPPPPQVISDDDSPLSSAPSSIGSPPFNEDRVNHANGDKETEPGFPGDGQVASREGILSQLNANAKDVLPDIDIPEEVLRELPQGAQRRFRKRTTIQLQPYALDLVQWQENQKRMGLPIHRRGHRGAEESQEQDSYEPALRSSSPPAEEYLPPVRHDRPRHDRERDGHEHAPPGQARVVKRRKTSHATPKGSRQLHRQIKPRGIRDDYSAAGNQNGLSIFDLTSSPPHTGRLSSTSRTPRASEGGFRFPRGWSPPGGVAESETRETEEAESESMGIAADYDDDDGGIQSIPSDSEQSDEQEDDSDAEAREIRRAQRQIRGVLPASHMRIEQKKLADQQKLVQREKDRQAALHRPDGKGVARKLVRRGDRSTQPATQQSRGLFDLGDSDDDDDDDGNDNASNAPVSSNTNRGVTSRFDSQDPFATDGDILEDNRIDYMFAPVVRKATGPRHKTNILKRPKSKGSASTGERHAKRPRQTRMTDASYGGRRTKKSSTVQRPRIGILDAPDVSTKSQNEQPRFLRIAARQAHSRRDAGRRSPTQKFLKLASRGDTEDANESLRDWRRGVIRQTKVSPPRPRARRHQPTKTQSLSGSRAPPAPRVASNSRHPQIYSQAFQEQADLFVPDAPTPEPEEYPSHSGAVPLAEPVPVTLRVPSIQTPQAEPSRRQPEKQGHTWVVPRNRAITSFTRNALRPAEASAAAPIRGQKATPAIFKNSLSTINRHYRNQRTSQNPRPSLTLDRYLSDNRSTSTEANPSLKQPTPNAAARPDNRASNQNHPQPRRRLKKRTPNRINLNTEQYQQNPDPAAIISDDSEAPAIKHVAKARPSSFTVGGLFNFQRFYPVEFGVTSLHDNTFFHESTFIGSGEFSRSLHVAKRNLDRQGNSFSIQVEDETFSWGSWNDTVSSEMGQVFDVIVDNVERSATTSPEMGITPTLGVASNLYRLLIKYITESLVFIDPVDRTGFVTRAAGLVSQVRDPLTAFLSSDEYNKTGLVKIACFDMVLSNQIRQVASHPLVSPVLASEALDLVKISAKDVAGLLASKASSSEFKALYKDNSELERRESGIRDDHPSVEAYVVITHILHNSDHYKGYFEELQFETCNSAIVQNERDVSSLEAGWRGLFTVLPLNEVDQLGIARPGYRFKAVNDNWRLAKRLLAAALDHFDANSMTQPISYNNYCRVLFQRCHRLINSWGWRECKPVLDALFDFFAKNTLHNLKLEEASGSPAFLDELDGNPSLDARPGEPCFHTFLKIVASGLRFLTKRYDKKKIRNFAWRLLPNHGRVYPKEQQLRREDLEALRNHHDLLSTLYWAVPDGCRPRLETIRNLVHPATSHREACSISLRSWSRLVRFKLSTDEDVSGLDPFGDWYGFFVTELHQQHSYARKEIESQNTGDNRVSQQLVERTISQNQRQIEELLSSALAGLRTAVQVAPKLEHSYRLVAKTPFESIISLFNPKLPRVNSVVSEALQVVIVYTQKDVTATSAEVPVAVTADEDSQEFGDWDAIEAVWDAQTPPSEGVQHIANVLHPIVSRLVSNCFGEDHCPADAMLLIVLECWTSVACVLVRHGLRSWDNYLSEYGDDSWTRLRRTVQTRKFAPLFVALCLEKDACILSDCRVEVISLWMSSLVERSSMLKFQHRLSDALMNASSQDPLLHNLPFFKDKKTGRYTITLEEINSRRISLLSSLFSNMRQQLQDMELSSNPKFSATKQEYSEIVQRVMTSMKDNYQELGNGTAQAVQGTYVKFVHNVIGFLQQHTSDMKPIDPFFTDPASFPLPSHDPRYIVAKLKRYEPKLFSSKEILTLNGFIQSLSERAAIDCQQTYLVDQLHTSMKDTYEAGNPEKPTLRTVLLQCVFPAYLEAALENRAAWILAHPIIQTITLEFQNLLRSIDTFDPACVSSVIEMIDIVCRASCQALSIVTSRRHRLQSPATLSMIGAFVEMVSSVLPIVDYIDRVTDTCEGLFVHIKWIHSFIKAATECLQSADLDADSLSVSVYVTFPGQPASADSRKIQLFDTAHHLASTDLQAYLSKWSYHQDKYYFTRPGHESQEITIEPRIAVVMASQNEARKAYEEAARGFNSRVVSLELF
ncbi:uncharacterized protein N7529_010033 [Penicillium soppii]|uniref:uncharacterized protein n=1 Tax=Penicillium soppii TaxID=69789 RepID=UPI002548D236|nr:uncharacterized protein N7529_010033 [Penicillium soppii]KAJ5856089.1 hypothetical protein N7529_010033 [Penicillium soppii]